MPQKIVCGGCSEVFYEGTDLRLPEEFMEQFKGVCPKCGRKLTFDPKNVEIHGFSRGKQI